jgi:hypothetical protein
MDLITMGEKKLEECSGNKTLREILEELA